MSLSTKDLNIIQDIIALEGRCMSSNRCVSCPFRSMCLPEFLNSSPPSPSQRENIAISVLTHYTFIDSDMSIDDLKLDYKWDKK